MNPAPTVSYPALDAALFAALACYALALGLTFFRPLMGRWPLALGAGMHLAGTAGRGWLVAFLPLSNKMESFSAAALVLAAVTFATWTRERRYTVPLLLLTVACQVAALSFPTDIHYPFALLRTLWYPLHVPLSFLSYALWCAAGAAGLAWLRGRDPAWLARVDRYALQGLAVWSISMFFGGIWGVVSWGAYFIWDPKVIWSVLLWFHYASFVHLRLSPSLAPRAWVRPALAWLGVVHVFVAYVGTSFFFGRGMHAF